MWQHLAGSVSKLDTPGLREQAALYLLRLCVTLSKSWDRGLFIHKLENEFLSGEDQDKAMCTNCQAPCLAQEPHEAPAAMKRTQSRDPVPWQGALEKVPGKLLSFPWAFTGPFTWEIGLTDAC